MVKEGKIPNPPALVEHKNTRFLIMDAPSDSNLPVYLTELKKHKVTDVVRVCDPSYHTELLTSNNIEVHDWAFGDGDPPPADIIARWLALIDRRFGTNISKQSSADKTSAQISKDGCIAIHCVAGLGRAPVLVAIALIEGGLEAEDAVSFIREKRKGAINNRQLLFLQKYKPHKKGGCIIS